MYLIKCELNVQSPYEHLPANFSLGRMTVGVISHWKSTTLCLLPRWQGGGSGRPCNILFSPAASPTAVEPVFEETKFKLCECLTLPFLPREKIFLTNTPRVWDKFS